MLLVSCGDDPELVKKREQQKEEIERLKGEIAIKEEMINALPPDRTRELQAAKEKAELHAKEVEQMEEEIALLEKKKRVLEKEVEDYKKKYPVNR
jgi:chromosome segregation ATPase